MIKIYFETETFTFPIGGEKEVSVFSRDSKILQNSRDYFIPLEDKKYLVDKHGEGCKSLLLSLNPTEGEVVGFYYRNPQNNSETTLFYLYIHKDNIYSSIAIDTEKDRVEEEIHNFMISYNLPDSYQIRIYGYNLPLEELEKLLLAKAPKFISVSEYQRAKKVKCCFIGFMIFAFIFGIQYLVDAKISSLKKNLFALQKETALVHDRITKEIKTHYLPYYIDCNNLSLSDVFYSLKDLEPLMDKTVKVISLSATQGTVSLKLESKNYALLVKIRDLYTKEGKGSVVINTKVGGKKVEAEIKTNVVKNPRIADNYCSLFRFSF